jgi:hypothetical protein
MPALLGKKQEKQPKLAYTGRRILYIKDEIVMTHAAHTRLIVNAEHLLKKRFTRRQPLLFDASQKKYTSASLPLL